jgi:hypothetical protein
MSGTIQTDTYMNIVIPDEITPGLINQRPVGLKAMRDMYTMRVELLCYLKSLLIKGDRQHKWFACMPDDRDAIGEKGRRKKNFKDTRECFVIHALCG